MSLLIFINLQTTKRILTVQWIYHRWVECEIHRLLRLSGQCSSHDDPADMGHESGPRPRSRLQSKLCLRVIWTCCWQQKGHDLDTDGMNAALSLAAQCGLVQCCWHRSFYTTGLWVRSVVSSWMKFPNSLTLSALVLFVFHRVRLRFTPHQNELFIFLGLVACRSSRAASTQ